MRSFQREAILRDPELSSEVAAVLGRLDGALPDGAARRAAGGDGPPEVRAIVQRIGRPSLVVSNGTFEVPVSDAWRARLDPAKSRLDAAVRSVGRVELTGASHPFVGTAWMVDTGLAVTNRHVALEFARRQGSEFVFRASPAGQLHRARIDFREEHGSLRAFECRVTRVVHIAGLDDDEPDVAFLALDPPGDRPLPPPIPLYDGEPQPGQTVAVIGYPAHDPRNSLADQAALFGDVYGVKRLAPGEVMARAGRGVFTHDATTLGGSSGSAVVDAATGAALGLHFAGEYLEANYAVTATTLRRLLREVERAPAAINPTVVARPEPDHRVALRETGGRDGFSERFLGTGALTVALPSMTRALAREAVVVDPVAKGKRRHLLPYAHFSVVTHGGRRTALYTAVNIDGSHAQRIKRTRDVWSFDPRLDERFQVGNVLYAGNDLDRGHLVRRLDPAWGTEAEARVAENDTFFYTNSAPQHAQFNQHLWLELEDYLLDNASTRGFKASVFTGPVLAADDKEYRGVRLPRAFWKVAVMVHADREELSATAYVVSQADLITDVEFVYGQFKTYQVPVRHIEVLTGLRFGRLPDFDPLAGEEGTTTVELVAPDQIRI